MAPSADIQPVPVTMSTSDIKSNYTQGHHTTVLKSHSIRTATKCAAYLLPHIEPHYRILDVGCGPGSISLGLAELVPQGSVTGIDVSSVAIAAAEEAAEEKGVKNVQFKIGDAYHLYWEDETFDIVHCHQCLIHVDEPNRVLKEMRRVCKKGGIVAAREADLGTLAINPLRSGMQKMWDISAYFIHSGGGEPNAGRNLVAWSREAGFQRGEITVTGTVDVASTLEERRVVGTTYPERMLASDIGKKAVEAGLVTREDLENIATAWKEWIDDDDGFFALSQTEVLCRK